MVIRPRAIIRRFFADSTHGGRAGALRKALRWCARERRRLKDRLPEFRPAMRTKAQRGSRTKILGVSRFWKRDHGRKVLVFAARIKTRRGSWSNRPFRVGRNYSQAEALAAAVRVRKEWERRVRRGAH